MYAKNCSISFGVAVITSPDSLSMVCLVYLMLGFDLMMNCLFEAYLVLWALMPYKIDVLLISFLQEALAIIII